MKGFAAWLRALTLRDRIVQSTLHLPDWVGEDELRQLTAEVLIDPRAYESGAANKKRGALIKTGERREWRKKPHQPNEALDIVVGARALASGEGAGQLTGAEWREMAAKAHGPREQPSLVPRAAGCARNSGATTMRSSQSSLRRPRPAAGTRREAGRKMTWGEAVAKFKRDAERINV